MSILRLPAKMESLRTFRSFVIGIIMKETDLEDITDRVDLVLEEVLVNIIHYAYPEGGYIEVECDITDHEMICISVKDWGIAFNPLDRDEPDLSKDISKRKVGGLGIHLVRHMASELKYERKNDVNILRISFKKDIG